MADGGAGTLRAGGTFFRAHGLGNDYLVFGPPEAGTEGWAVTPAAVRAVCHRTTGVGSDGIVVLEGFSPADGVFPLRMFNPDGSAFERSGNGLRILGAFLLRRGLVELASPFRVRSGGDEIGMTAHALDDRGRHDISVEMGQARVGPDAFSIVAEALDREGRALHPVRGAIAFTPVSVGNPHAVVFVDRSDEALLAELGPFLTAHPAFPAGANVQLATVLGPDRIGIRIWERGVGRTSASGTSSCAVAAAAVATGRVAPGPVRLEMEGGHLEVRVGTDLEIELRGPVDEICEGELRPGFVRALAQARAEGGGA